MSARENVLEALFTTLTPILPGSVWRSRKEQFPSLPAIVISPLTEEGQGDVLGRIDCTLSVAIAVYARAEIPDQAADQILEDILSALNADTTIGLGSDVQILPSRRIDWAIENHDDNAATLHLEILYRK